MINYSEREPDPSDAATHGTLEALPSRRETGVIDVLIALGDEKRVLFGFPIVIGIIAAIWSLLLPPAYTATTTILPPQQSQQSAAMMALQQLGGLAAVAAPAAGGLKKPEDLYITMLSSEGLQNAIITKLGLMQQYGTKLMADARKQLSDHVSVSADKGGLLVIAATAADPNAAAKLANVHVEELQTLLSSLAVTEAQQRRLFFEKQLLSTKEQLVKAETALKEIQERTGLIVLEKQGEAIIEAVASLRAQIVAKEVQLQAMRNFATANNAELQVAQSQIVALRAQLGKMEAGSVRGDGDVIVPTGKVPETGLKYVRAMREVKYQEAIFQLLSRQFEAAKVDEAREGPLVQQVYAASAPERRSKPRRGQIVAIAVVLGGLLGVLVALTRVAWRGARTDPRYAGKVDLLLSSWLRWRRR